MRFELKRPWPGMRAGNVISCGGNQDWFPDRNFRACGCGVVACADVLLYLRRVQGMTQADYMDYVNSLRRSFPLIPYRGIDGVRLVLGLNACFRREGLRVRAHWRLSGAKFWDRLARMLADDLPAIVSVGPNFPRIWGKEQLPLYRRTGSGFERTSGAKAHFLTVTALDDEWMRVSSWGRELYIERRAYADYMRRQGALFTNLVYLERI